jgi:hypothetical protein
MSKMEAHQNAATTVVSLSSWPYTFEKKCSFTLNAIESYFCFAHLLRLFVCLGTGQSIIDASLYPQN